MRTLLPLRAWRSLRENSRSDSAESSLPKRATIARVRIDPIPLVRVLAFLIVGVCDVARAEPLQRIVSLAPNLTELAFAAGAGDRIKGTVEFSDEPAAARAIPRVGDAFRVDIERILAIRPDVVLAWHAGTPKATIDKLRKLSLDVRELDTQRLADIPRVVRELGRLAATEAIAEAAAKDFEAQMQDLRSRYTDHARIRVFLQVSTRPLYTINGRQLMSELLELCGATNVFADLDVLAPQVSIEAVIARDPEVIISTDDGDPTGLEQWRELRHLTAVRANNLYTLPADDLTRATPRLASGAGQLCRVLETARGRRAAAPGR